MHSKKPRSRQEAIQQKRQSTFVGREQQLDQFRYNLALPPEDWYFLFNIWGQGGVGKSTLLRQFRKLAEHTGCITAVIDEGTTSVPEAMGRLAEQLGQQGHPLKQFSERYKVFRQKKQELEADLEAPQGLSAFLGRTAAKAGLGLAKQIPGSGAVTPFLDEEVISTQAGEWAAFVAQRLTNKDEVRLMNHPEAVLTPLFLEDLSQIAAQVNLLLAFDTYERTSDFLDGWLREILTGQHGELPLNLLLVIAGREQLNPNDWSDYKDMMARLPLDPFTEAEAKQYLTSKNITEPQVREVIWQLSQGLPVLVAMLASNSPTTPEQVGEPSGTAVERFLKWETDPQRRQVALDAALCRCLNRDVLALIVGNEEVDALFQWLTKTPFVEERSDGWAYHDIVRTQMLRYKRRTSPQSWADLHGKLANYYEKLRSDLGLDEHQQWNDADWQQHWLNWLYHYLCQSPQQHLSTALNQFLLVFDHQRQFAQQWAEQFREAGKDRESEELQRWGKTLIKGLNTPMTADEKCYKIVIQMWTALLKNAALGAKEQSIALTWRGEAYYLMKQYEKALSDFSHAIEQDPNYIEALALRGETYRSMQRYEEALQDLNRAAEDIELNSNSIGPWLMFRGETYRSMQCYEEALQDLNRAAELDPDMDWSQYQGALTHQALDQPEPAKANLERAIQVARQRYEGSPHQSWNTFNLALYYLVAGNIEQAKQFYRDGIARNATATSIQDAITDIEDFLKSLPQHPMAEFARQVKRWLEKQI